MFDEAEAMRLRGRVERGLETAGHELDDAGAAAFLFRTCTKPR